MASPATKKKPREPIAPWGDIDLASLPDAAARERVELAMRAFDRGDLALLRALARELAASPDETVRNVAARLSARTAVDPVQVLIVVACALFLVVVALKFAFLR